MTTLAHVIFPQDRATETMPLYVAAPGPGATVRSGRDVVLPARATTSFATYFNAFPAGHWRRSTVVRHVRLEAQVTGSGVLRVHRSDAEGAATPVAERSWSDRAPGDPAQVTVDLSIAEHDDGGWLWFDVEADDEVRLGAARWVTDDPLPEAPRASIGITTFNKPDYCVRTLGRLAAAPETLELLDRIYVVDQGTRKVVEEDGAGQVVRDLGERLQILDQPNLGGSGGFARAMMETTAAGTADFVLLLDDDVRIEPEGIARAIRFASACPTPTIVGGHMFDMNAPTVLHAWSEVVEQRNFMWGPADTDLERHDFARAGLRSTPALHRPGRTDYNGWWMCLIPTSVVREAGLALPVFIKWDDAEYALRAAEHGVRTVTLPGAALWHVTWLDKDDSLDWQAYFHGRNRLIAALLHAELPRGGALLTDTGRLALKQLLSMQYYAVSLRNQAMRDVLAGPGNLHESLPTRLAELRQAAADFPETHVRAPGSVPVAAPAGSVPPPAEQGPRGARLALFTGRSVLRHLLPVRRRWTGEAQAELPRTQGRWWTLPGYDSVLVRTADGSGMNWYRRDRRRFLRLWGQSVLLHRRIARQWDELSSRYRAELPAFTAPQAWRQTFGLPAEADEPEVPTRA